MMTPEETRTYKTAKQREYRGGLRYGIRYGANHVAMTPAEYRKRKTELQRIYRAEQAMRDYLEGRGPKRNGWSSLSRQDKACNPSS